MPNKIGRFSRYWRTRCSIALGAPAAEDVSQNTESEFEPELHQVIDMVTAERCKVEPNYEWNFKFLIGEYSWRPPCLLPGAS